MSRLLPIAGFERLSLSDWPGHVAAIVFTQGCNFRCPWCHNPELVYPEHFTPTLPCDGVEHFLSLLNPCMYDGVIITGGEPTIHKSTLPELCWLVKSKGLKVRLDTNGADPDFLLELLDSGLVDEIALDYKLPLARYPELGCTKPDKVAESLALVAQRWCGYIRSTLIKGVHTDELLDGMASELASIAGKDALSLWYIQDYRRGTPQYYWYSKHRGDGY